jgi:flagellar export protein FliJ
MSRDAKENTAKSRNSGSLGLLARLAENKVQAGLHQLAEVQKTLAKNEHQKKQIAQLKQDYAQRLSALTVDKGLTQAQELRKFIQNLLTMEEKLLLEQQVIEQKLAAAQAALQEAQLEKRKMESLVERNEAKAAKAQSIVEQRALDAAGLARFNRKQATA